MTEVSLETVPRLLGEVTAEQARLDVVKTMLATRLIVAAGRVREVTDHDGDLLDVKQAAHLLQISPHWVYRNAKTLPFTRRIGPRSLRFSAEGIRRYVAGRRP